MNVNKFLDFNVKNYERYLNSYAFGNKYKENANNVKQALTMCLELFKQYKTQNDDKNIIDSNDSIEKLTQRMIRSLFPGVESTQLQSIEITFNKMFKDMNECITYNNEMNSERLKTKSKFDATSFDDFLNNIYIPLLGKDLDVFVVEQIKNIKPVQLFVTNFAHAEMNKCFKDYGVVKLRELNKEAKTLIIGCGHDRLRAFFNPDIESFIDYAEEMREYHSHEGEITVDIDLCVNPDILANFGTAPLAPVFQGQTFETIIFEGFYPDKVTKEMSEDIAKLLKRNGKVLLIAVDEEDKTADFLQSS